jgi:archaellum component FlaC
MTNWKRKSDTYVAIYTKMREEREHEIQDLRKEVRELKGMVEFLCKKVFE